MPLSPVAQSAIRIKPPTFFEGNYLTITLKPRENPKYKKVMYF